ncbi:MAG: response regulator, partial [Acidobacteria bacterium]|nr:response regulator [Acidobacteriota bacterium]
MPALQTVLVVDDDRFVRMALTEALRSWSYTVVEAGRIDEARKAFADEEPAIVLLDIDLPDGSGIDLLTDIKSQSPD